MCTNILCNTFFTQGEPTLGPNQCKNSYLQIWMTLVGYKYDMSTAHVIVVLLQQFLIYQSRLKFISKVILSLIILLKCFKLFHSSVHRTVAWMYFL